MSYPSIRIAEIINGTRFNRFHLNLLVLACLTQFVEGFEMQLIGYTAPAMSESLHVGKFTFGWLFAANNVGFLCGALLLSTLGDKLGRKRMIALGALMFGVFTLAVGYSNAFSQTVHVTICPGFHGARFGRAS